MTSTVTGLALRRTRVKSLAELKRGDHVSWQRELGYWHHALVKAVYIGSGEILVIEYAKQDTGVFIVCENRYNFDQCFKDLFYRYNYTESELDDQDPVERAESRIGEREYDLLTNNCEHFVGWCKTGRKQSDQVDNGVVKGITNLYAVILLMEGAAKGASKMIGGACIVFNVAVDAWYCAYEINKAKKAFDKGHIDRKEYHGIIVQETAEAATASYCAMIGLGLGCCGGPFGGVLGGMLGGIVGAVISRPVGKQFGDLVRK